MFLPSSRRVATSIAAVALALSVTAARAADLPPAGMKILDWPRMTSPAFGCLLEKTLGHRDPRFNCALKSVKPGDPCIDTADYHAGPKFPPALAPRVHTLASNVDLAFEHGQLQSVTVMLTGKFSEAEVRRAFGLPDDAARPANVSSISVQDCSLLSTCLVVQGFEHMGAADVDCPPRPPKPPPRR